MKTVIIYSSKYGCAKDCAEYIKDNTSKNGHIIDINKSSEKINLNEYDTVVIGSSIYVGMASKKIRVFCNENIDELSKKNLGIFLCCGFTGQSSEYIKNNFPAKLADNAKSVKVFGGEARISKMSFVDKIVMKAATKGNYDDLKIIDNNLKEFVSEMKA